MPWRFIIFDAGGSFGQSRALRRPKVWISVRDRAKDLFALYAKSRGEGFGNEVRRRIMLGCYVLSHGYYDAYYKKSDAGALACQTRF